MDEGDDDLDEVLEAMLSNSSAVCSSSEPGVGSGAETPSPGITFSFPGWGVDIYQDRKRQTSVKRHSHSEKGRSSCERPLSLRRDWSHLQAPKHGSPVSDVPDEVLLRVFSLVAARDLAASREVCKRWYALCSSDCLWERELDSSATSKDDLPRWLVHKHGTLLTSRINRMMCYSKRYDFLIEALDAWWEHGQPHGKYSSSKLCPLIREITLLDWCVVYEVLSSAFANRADCLGTSLLKKLHTSSKSKNSRKAPNLYDLEAVDLEDGVAGMKIWKLLRSLWQRYISWVKLISLHCSDLNYAVRLERGRTVGTPKLYDKGVICFRSQVLLSYGLRSVLQAGLSWLSNKETEGTASEQDVELLCALHHLLQELDVPDDSTLHHQSFTQAKFRRCFLDGESSNDYSKAQILAARMEYM